ncbi:MAG: RdgB/HAM1 family non-canonical purine NTP pyrophosphatase [Gemmatimonadaceae bacterium]
MRATDLLLATRSAGKIAELRPLLEAAGFIVTDLTTRGLPATEEEDRLESHGTFEGNALAKARHFSAVSGGLAVIAEDSGLEVAGLGGRPGVLSKRWSDRRDLAGRALDEANNRHLVREMRGVMDRRARFVCAAAFVGCGVELVASGVTSGRIVEQPRGAGGFGYDPYFESSDLGITFGEADLAGKQRVSHRARAVHQLIVAINGSVDLGSAPA